MACQYIWKGEEYSREEFAQYIENNPSEFSPFLQDQEVVPSKASPKTLSLIRDFMQKLGINEKKVNEIVVNGQKLNADGVAYPLEKLVEVVNGKEDVALPEEAMHIAVEILEQKDPSLFNQLLGAISKYQLYRNVFDVYKNDKLYQTSDGKPDVRKIKKEAIAKALVEQIISQTEGTNEKPENLAQVQTWWQKIINFLQNLFSKTTNPFQQVAEQIAEGTFENGEAISTSPFLQKAEENKSQDDLYKRIKNESNVTIKKITEEENSYFRNGEKVKKRVTDLVKDYYNKIFNRGRVNEEQVVSALDEARAQKGTDGHADIESILHRYIDDNGELRIDDTGALAPLGRNGEVSRINPRNDSMYNTLEQNLKERLEQYQKEYPGTRFLMEQVVYDPTKDEAGTIDFMAILPNGKVDILDWKFINVDTTKTNDVPWYKQGAFNIQIEEYKRILKNVYGVEGFRKTEAIPIATKYKIKGKEITLAGIRIGNTNVKLEENAYLLPVPTRDQSSGNKQVDEFMAKLNNLYKRISNTNVEEGRKDIKKEQMNKLVYAIRQLQVRQNMVPALEYAKILQVESDALIQHYNEQLKDKPSTEPSDKELGDYFRKLISLIDKYNPYLDIDVNLNELFKDDEEGMQLLEDVSSNTRIYLNKLNTLLKESGDKFLGERNDVIGLTIAEKDLKGIASTFRTISQGNTTSALTAFYKMTEPLLRRIDVEQNLAKQEFAKITEAYSKWAESKGLNAKNMFSPIMQKGKNKLIDTIQKEFFEEFAGARESHNTQWFKDNVDIEAFSKWAKEQTARELQAAEGVIYDSDPEKNKELEQKNLAKIKEKYNISTAKSNGWGNYAMLQFVKEKWYSPEYKELLKSENKPALDLFNYQTNLNNQAATLGVIQPRVKRTFLPWVRKNGINEKMVFGGSFKFDGFIRGLTVQEDDYAYGYRDPLTGELQYDIHARYTSDFSGGDMNEVSTNLFKTITLFQDEIIKYSNLREVTDSVEALLRLEKIKQSLLTDNGKIIRENGIAQTKDSNENNYQKLFEHVQGRLYGIKKDESDLNITFGKIGDKWDENAKKINQFIGKDVLSTNMSGRSLSLSKFVTVANKYFQSKTLVLNLGIPLSNTVGGFMQEMINAKTYYDKGELAKASLKVTSVAFNDEQGKVLNALIKIYQPFAKTEERHKYIHLSASKLADTSFIRDLLMTPYKYGDMLVEMPHIVAMYSNAIIVDGNLINVNKYLADKYKGKNSLPREQRKTLEDQIEKEKKVLLEEKGLLKLAKVENNKLIIEGMNLTDKSLLNYASITKNLAKQFLGAADPDDLALASRKLIHNSFLVFKNWIPPLADKRIGELRYAPGTDEYEWGRMRMCGKIIVGNLHRSAGIFLNILKGNEKGIQFMTDMLEKKRQDYKNKYNKELEIGSDEFIQLVRDNVKNQFVELAFATFLTAALLSLSALVPDDTDPETRGYWAFSQRMANKIYDEIMFYYNPMSFTQIANGSVFPGLGVVNDIYNFSKNLLKEGYGLATNDETITDAAHPAKYLLKFSSLTNNLMYYIGVASPDFAKEMGIHISSQSRQY